VLVYFTVVEDQNPLQTGVQVHRRKLSDELRTRKQGWISQTHNLSNDEVKKPPQIERTNEDSCRDVTVHTNRGQDAVALPPVEPSVRIRRSPLRRLAHSRKIMWSFLPDSSVVTTTSAVT
jgi:hypothetical protein